MDDDCSSVSNSLNSSSSSLNSSFTSCEKNIINRRKILKDLNSPSASVRLRAIRALKDPTQSSYHFDVPHEMQDIITEEERKTPVKPISFEEVMKDVKVYCDIRSEDGENVTSYIKDVIKSYGVNVNDRFVKNTTHVVFKKGTQSTYEKAKRLNIPIVSILWITECKKRMTLVNPTLFKISDLHKYENPELYSKIRQKRSRSASPILHSTTKLKKHKLLDEKNSGRILQNKSVLPSSNNDKNLINLTPSNKNSSQSLMKTALLKHMIKNNGKNKNCDKKEENSINNDNADNSVNKRTIKPKRRSLFNPINMEEKAGSSKTLVNDNNSNVNKSTVKSGRRSLFNPINMEESMDSLKKNVGPKNDSDSSFICDLEFNVNFNKTTNQLQDMEETLKIKENFENVLKSSSVKISKKRKYTSYNRQSLDITTVSVSEENLKEKDENDDDNDENLRPTPTSTKENLVTPKNLTSIFSKTTTIYNKTAEPSVKKRKLFVHDILLSPSSNSSSSSSKSTASTPIPSQNHSSSFHKRLTQQKHKSPLKENNNNPNDRKKEHQKEESDSSDMEISTINKKRRSSIDFNFNKSNIKLTSQKENKIKELKGMVCTSVTKKEHIDFIKQAIKKLGGFVLEDKVTNRTTHVICIQIRRTMNLLRGMIRGLWILNYDWIINSVNCNKWLYEEEYEIRNFSRTIQISRSQRQAFGKNYRMELFENLGEIYVSENSKIPAKNLIELITLCNGKITKTKTNAKYIIGEYYNEKTNNDDDNDNNLKKQKICVNPEWILNSIMNNRVQKYRKYLIKTS